MKLFFLRFLTIAAAGSLFLVAVLAFRPVEKNNSAGGQLASIAEVFPHAPNADRILLQGPGGGVWVDNFYKVAKGALPGDNAVLVVEAEEYKILYHRDDSSFEVALNFSALAPVKNAAENSLFDVLGAGKPELCKLKIFVSTINSGGDKEFLPLSFCQSVFKAK